VAAIDQVKTKRERSAYFIKAAPVLESSKLALPEKRAVAQVKSQKMKSIFESPCSKGVIGVFRRSKACDSLHFLWPDWSSSPELIFTISQPLSKPLLYTARRFFRFLLCRLVVNFSLWAPPR